MIAAKSLVSQCADARIRLSVVGTDITYRCPKGALKPDLRRALLEHKAEVVDFLAHRSNAKSFVYEVTVDGRKIMAINPACDSLEQFTASQHRKFGSERVGAIKRWHGLLKSIG